MDLQKPCSLLFLIPAFFPWENGTAPDPAHPCLRSLPGRLCQPSLGSAAPFPALWALFGMGTGARLCSCLGSRQQLCQMFPERSKSPETGEFRVSSFGSGLGHGAKFIK